MTAVLARVPTRAAPGVREEEGVSARVLAVFVLALAEPRALLLRFWLPGAVCPLARREV